MKIAQICAVDFTLAHFLLPLMKGMRDAGHDVVGICADGPLLKHVREEGFRVETVPISRSFNIIRHAGSYRRLKNLMRDEKFDLVHVHTPVASLVGRAAARRARVPHIAYTAHGFYFHERMPATKRRLFQSLEWIAGRVTHTLFTQAQEDADTARQLKLARRGATIQAIGNGVDPARFSPDESGETRLRVRAALGEDLERPVILMTGRLVAEKGYPELFEAMRDVDAALWVIGDRLESDHAAAIDDAIESARADPVLKDRIRLLGYRKDVPDLLRAADIFTLPSHREGMPRSIIEAMMTGLPVVGTDIRGTREEILPGKTGLLVPVSAPAALARALSQLVDDLPLRTAMGAAGRQRALDLYDEQKVIDRQIDLLGLNTPHG